MAPLLIPAMTFPRPSIGICFAEIVCTVAPISNGLV
jgi:hypothetical protein